jgi:hypothetical protein
MIRPPLPFVAVNNQALLDSGLNFLPVLVLLVVFYFVLRRFQMRTPTVQLQKKYIEQQLELMPRIEALLERIAKALNDTSRSNQALQPTPSRLVSSHSHD